MHGNGTEWLDFDLPTPSYHAHSNKGYLLAYALDGFFGTKKNQEYLNDVIARFLITFKDYKPERLPYKPNITSLGTYLPKIYKLQEFQALKSISKKKCPQARADKFDDFVFWAIKLHCESLIEEYGIASYSQLREFTITNFPNHKKGISTPLCKCKSVWNWYDERDWKIPKRKKYNTDEELKELLMTRQERARANAQKKEAETKIKILNFLNSFESLDCKKKNGSWNASKIASFLNMKPHTVSKHLKALIGENND